MTVRVAVAELQTMVYRALVAQGASTGEAEAAAAACAEAEVHGAGGLVLAVDALDRVPRERVGAQVEDGSPARLVDPAARALILQARMALDWLASHRAGAIALPGERGAGALIGALPCGILALDFANGEPVGGCAVTADGALVRFDGDPGCVAPAVADGIVLLAAGPPTGTVTGPAERRNRWLQACADGVLVDAAPWRALLVGAERYLVPEA